MHEEVREGEWLSQQQAADLVGVPVATVEFAARSGKFVKRSQAPSLRRDSVLTWAKAREERKWRTSRPRKPTHEPMGKRPPEPTGWLEVGEAAQLLDVSRYTVLRYVADGLLEKRRSGMQWYVPEREVAVLAQERTEWVSQAAAAAIVGCSLHAIERATREGRIQQRDAPRWIPSLRRESVERFASLWQQDQQAEAVRRRERIAERRPASAPPDDGDVWLPIKTVAVMLRLSTSRVEQLTQREALPATRRGHRWWYRRGDIERYAAARAARHSGGATLHGPDPLSHALLSSPRARQGDEHMF